MLKKLEQHIASDPTMPVRRAFDKVLDEPMDCDSDLDPDWDGRRTRAKRLRSAFLPPIPHDIQDVDRGRRHGRVAGFSHT